MDQHSAQSQPAISLEVYAQAREAFVLFESLPNAAQTRRLLLNQEPLELFGAQDLLPSTGQSDALKTVHVPDPGLNRSR